MLTFAREPALRSVRAFLEAGAWCALELCSDIPAQRWQPRLIVCDGRPSFVVDAIAQELDREPNADARITAYHRARLEALPGIPSHLCQVDTVAPVAARTPMAARDPSSHARPMVLVRDGMNQIVVTVGPGHTLRDAARRMTSRGVGAAVVLGGPGSGPGIITERDILRSNGVGQDIDDELVRDHLTSGVVHAAADWSLERAAGTMVSGGFRHVIVLDDADVVGILSMRDIVRCWTHGGATRGVPPWP